MSSNNIQLGLKKRIALETHRLMRKLATREHKLTTLFWECTLRCGLNCKHCGSDCKTTSSIADMPKEDFFKVLDNIAEEFNPNNILIIFSGGEPLMRTDLEECASEVRRRGFHWGMVTNGMLLTRKRFESLLSAGLETITVSFDGFEQEHNWLRGNKDSYNNVIRSIDLFKSAPGLTWDVVTCVNKRNINTMSEFADFLIRQGVKNWRLFTIFPSGRAMQDAELVISNEQYVNLLKMIAELRKNNKIHASFACEGFLGKFEGEVRDNLYICEAGICVASIRIDGSISGCNSIRDEFSQGNIYRDNFVDVWNNKFDIYRNKEWAKRGECADCSMFRYCEGNGMHLHRSDGSLVKCNLPKC